MMKKTFPKFAALGLTFALAIPGTAAFAETPSTSNDNVIQQENPVEIQQENRSIEVFDKDGNLVKAYSKEEIDALQNQLAKAKEVQTLGITYSFGYTQFNDNVWIGGGKKFYRPKSVILDPAKYIKNLAVRVYDDSSQYIGEVSAKGFNSEINIPISHLTPSGNYKIKLQNRDIYDVAFHSGHVWE
ncbi:hypothetical protein AB8Q00_21955 [Bacillus cereus]|uniref:hypothetical protein n=2 Tax=Bacillus TaxID=1386 RepID=UPI0014564A2A|nr:hypothetical protein [Bacillus sp. ISTL8]